MLNSRWFLLLFCIGILTACDADRVFDEYKTIPDASWHKDSLVSFNVRTKDTTNAYNLFINLRNNSDYRYNNIFLITAMNFPNGKVVKDTLEYEMAYPDGSFMGEGFTDIKESKLWYKKGVIFAEKGEYTFTIKQAMRKNAKVEGIEELQGITDVGFRIENTKQVSE